MPPWDMEIKDVNEAVQKYGKIYTLHTIVGYAEFNEPPNTTRSKKMVWLKAFWDWITSQPDSY